MATRHACPGCGTSVHYLLLACSPCWWRLPQPLRRKVSMAFRSRETDPRGHRVAVAEAKAWYEQKRREASR